MEKIIKYINLAIIAALLLLIFLNKCNNNNINKLLKNKVNNLERIVQGKDSTIAKLNNILDTIKTKPEAIVYVQGKLRLDTVLKTNTIYREITLNDTIIIDTCYQFNYNDSFNYITGIVCKDSTKLSLQSATDVYFVYENKSNLFKNKYNIYANFTNPNIIIEDVGYSIMTPKVRRVGLGVQLGFTTGRSVIVPYIGIGISYNILTF